MTVGGPKPLTASRPLTASPQVECAIHVLQGEFKISADPNVVLKTVLGSCIAACLRDPVARIGGMNHFLLPGDDANPGGAERYGVHLMELLVNDLMRHGAQRDRLEAKIFGGARMMRGFSDIGQRNADFAQRFLECEGIRVVSGDVGGESSRRINYWPVSGRAQQSRAALTPMADRAQYRRQTLRAGDVDLF